MAAPQPPTPEEASKLVRGEDKIKRAARDFPPVVTTASSKLVPIFDGDGVEAAWEVSGIFPLIPFIINFPCTMTVYRSANGELTLFNALRVSTEIEDEILALGRVANVVKIGQFHGVADAYWVLCEKFGRPQYWTLPRGTVAEGLKADCILAADNVPVEGAILYHLEGHPLAEAVMTVPVGEEGPLLIACDALSHILDTVGMPIIGRAVMNLLGALSTPGVPQLPPVWCKKTVQMMGKDRTKAWFDDILQLDWRAFVGAHGVSTRDCDHETARAVIYKAIGV